MRRIARYPLMGHRLPEYAQLPLRQFIVEPYQFFYVIDVKQKRVLIVDVWHGAQIPAEPKLPHAGPSRSRSTKFPVETRSKNRNLWTSSRPLSVEIGPLFL